jgi:hypothetical protein
MMLDARPGRAREKSPAAAMKRIVLFAIAGRETDNGDH